MKPKFLSSFKFGNTIALYETCEEDKRVRFSIYPSSMEEKRVVKEEPSWTVFPLVHLKIKGESFPNGYSTGLSLLCSESTYRLILDEQYTEERDGKLAVVTRLKSDNGKFLCEHHAMLNGEFDTAEVFTVFKNISEETLTLDMLSSFALSGISPFEKGDSKEDLIIHRARSRWAAEGRFESLYAEKLHLERSESAFGVMSERFGQIGTMPSRGFFPFVAVTSQKAGVSWAANLSWASSWQIELYRRDNYLYLAGGLADREFGQWQKKVKAKSSFKTPSVYLSTAVGNLDDVCDNLTRLYSKEMGAEDKDEMALCFNEWCTSWGTPSAKNAIEAANRIRNLGIKYFVIDAGWYCEKGEWGTKHGDWQVNKRAFPNGIKETADALKEMGFIPGIWFEMESVGAKSKAAEKHKNNMLHLDNTPYTPMGRFFWDLRKEESHRYIEERVIDFIEENGFGYVKIDYNETLAFGVDGEDSPAEEMRKHTEGIYRLFNRFRERLPSLVIENCASGGHRLEPSMQRITDIGSFSDAHETLNIPIVAANLQRLIAPRKSLIWAVLRKEDSLRRTYYSLSATLLGRVCLSGDITEIPEENFTVLKEFVDFYSKVKHIIADGKSIRYGNDILSYRYPKGYQTVCRYHKTSSSVLLVAHSFGKDSNLKDEIDIILEESDYEKVSSFHNSDVSFSINKNIVKLKLNGEFSSSAILLKKK